MERRLSQSQSQGRETEKIGSDMPNHTSPGLKISICRGLGQRHSSECLQPSVEQDECSVMVWSCTSASGMGDLITINGIVNTEKEISDFDPPCTDVWKASRWCFICWHDDEPKQTANAIKAYLCRKTHNEHYYLLPLESSNLKIIEADHLDREKNKM